MTYDIAYAGPRNRYTVATNAGPVIVHNCGYGMGHKKFQKQLKTFKVDMSEDEARRVITAYRETYPRISELWRSAQRALSCVLENKTTSFGRDDVLFVEGLSGIRLPNGLYIRYPNLRITANEQGNVEYVYDTLRGKTVIPNRIYGGKVVENVTQALARIIIGDQMLMIAKKYKVALTVHDAICCVAPNKDLDTAKEFVEICMRMRPTWAPDLPLNCEAGLNRSYGGC